MQADIWAFAACMYDLLSFGQLYASQDMSAEQLQAKLRASLLQPVRLCDAATHMLLLVRTCMQAKLWMLVTQMGVTCMWCTVLHAAQQGRY